MTPDELRSSMSYATSERTLRDELNRMKTLGIVDVTGRTRTRKWYLIQAEISNKVMKKVE